MSYHPTTHLCSSLREVDGFSYYLLLRGYEDFGDQPTGKKWIDRREKRRINFRRKPIRLKNHPALIYPVTSRHHNVPNQLINRLYRIFKLNLNLIPYSCRCSPVIDANWHILPPLPREVREYQRNQPGGTLKSLQSPRWKISKVEMTVLEGH